MDNLRGYFHKYVIIRKRGDRFEAKCKKGFFSADAPTREQCESEAMYYFSQYWGDGEYIEDPEEYRNYVTRILRADQLRRELQHKLNQHN